MIRVLIVDDSAFMRKVITDLLKKMNGVEPAEIARNGKAAVDTWQPTMTLISC